MNQYLEKIMGNNHFVIVLNLIILFVLVTEGQDRRSLPCNLTKAEIKTLRWRRPCRAPEFYRAVRFVFMPHYSACFRDFICQEEGITFKMMIDCKNECAAGGERRQIPGPATQFRNPSSRDDRGPSRGLPKRPTIVDRQPIRNEDRAKIARTSRFRGSFIRPIPRIRNIPPPPPPPTTKKRTTTAASTTTTTQRPPLPQRPLPPRFNSFQQRPPPPPRDPQGFQGFFGEPDDDGPTPPPPPPPTTDTEDESDGSYDLEYDGEYADGAGAVERFKRVGRNRSRSPGRPQPTFNSQFSGLFGKATNVQSKIKEEMWEKPINNNKNGDKRQRLRYPLIRNKPITLRMSSIPITYVMGTSSASRRSRHGRIQSSEKIQQSSPITLIKGDNQIRRSKAKSANDNPLTVASENPTRHHQLLTKIGRSTSRMKKIRDPLGIEFLPNDRQAGTTTTTTTTTPSIKPSSMNLFATSAKSNRRQSIRFRHGFNGHNKRPRSSVSSRLLRPRNNNSFRPNLNFMFSRRNNGRRFL